MPWKNGGGETAEIAVFPPDADLSSFHWRISMATVAVDGPFSTFPGIDRTLTILSGDGMKLDIEGKDEVILSPASDPLSFPADTPTTARLSNATVVDFNVMTRRGICSHSVRREILPLALQPSQYLRLVLCLDDAAELNGESLKKHDAILLEPYESGINLRGTGGVLVAEILKST